MKNYFFNVCIFLLCSILGLTNVNAQFIEDAETVDIVMIPGFDNDGNLDQYYMADLSGSVEWTTEVSDSVKWYKMPAGAVSNGTTDVQSYYYKNVATGKYLYVSEEAQSELEAERTGDWPITLAQTTETNAKTEGFKWFDRTSPWSWGVYISNAAGIDLTQAEGNQYNVLTGILLMKVNEGGVNGQEFFGVYEPNGSVGGFKGGTGNAWTAVKTPVVVETGVLNPDVPHFLENSKTVSIVQISTWMAPNNSKLGGAKPYASDSQGKVVYSTDASADNTHWYEIPAGGNEFGQQLYYYKNVATGAYLTGSTRTPGEGGDWTVSEATTSATNDGSNLIKWTKMDSNWGNGPWLINEQGNTGTRPAGDNKNAFFAFTMLTANTEFFGVDVPNVAISNPHDGGNAWTAVQITVTASGVENPDYRLENTRTVNVIQISTWMAPNNTKLAGTKPFASDSQGKVVYSTDASADSTKWYEIPAGAGTYGQQVYYYKNVATGAYLTGSTRTPGEGGDWTVSEATSSKTNDGTNLFKWSKMDSNWGNGPWLVNEQGNTGTRPAGGNTNAFFALTMLTANSEFFGVDVPNVALSNPHDGGNAWTAVQMNILESAINPDYQSDGTFAYGMDSLNFFATDAGEDAAAASYDSETHTITYKNGGWHRAGWTWEAEGGLDVSAFNQVWIKLDASALPKTGDGQGGATKLQFDVVYMDDSNAAEFDNKSNEIRSNVTEYFYNLTPGKKVKRITLKSEAEGNVALTDAYFYFKGIDPVDLIVTDISWTPENPVLGDSILLRATIKNQSEFASQDIKHGIVFSVFGTVIAWSDTHLTALAPGEEITLTANGGPKEGNGKWKPALPRTFTVKAEVNDQHDVFESDYTNNTFQKDIVVSRATGINEIALKEKVYVANGKIYLINFPDSAVLSIYNIQGQKIGIFSTSEISKLTLNRNLYIIKSQVGEKVSTFKVLIN